MECILEGVSGLAPHSGFGAAFVISPWLVELLWPQILLHVIHVAFEDLRYLGRPPTSIPGGKPPTSIPGGQTAHLYSWGANRPGLLGTGGGLLEYQAIGSWAWVPLGTLGTLRYPRYLSWRRQILEYQAIGSWA